MERIVVGVEGFDELVDGGIPSGNTVLISGPAGSGKTIFSLEFIVKGAEKGEKGIYLSLEESEENLVKICNQFGWDIKKYLDNDIVRILRYDPYRYENVMEILLTNLRELNAKRIVIDSVSAMNLYIQDIREIRKTLVDIQNLTNENKAVSFLVSEIPADNLRKISSYGVEEFVCDGIIVLYYLQAQTEFTRSILVWKMRASNHSRKIHPFKITNNGIKIYPREEAFVKIE